MISQYALNELQTDLAGTSAGPIVISINDSRSAEKCYVRKILKLLLYCGGCGAFDLPIHGENRMQYSNLDERAPFGGRTIPTFS